LACQRNRSSREARQQAAPTASSAGPSQCHDRPGLCAFANRKPKQKARQIARTLFFDKAEAGAVAAEELQTTDTRSRGPQRPRLHGSSWRNDYARIGGSVLSNCSCKHECEKTRAKQRANQAVRINPIGSAVAADKSLQRAATHLARYRDCARVARRSDRLHGKISPQRAERGAAISGAWRREILGTEAGKGVKEEGGSGSRGVGDRQKGRGRVGERRKSKGSKGCCEG